MPPALDRAVVENGAGVATARKDRRDGASCPEIDRRQRVAHLARPVAPRPRVAEAELPAVVEPPALDLAVVEDGAAVLGAARGNGDGLAARAECDRRQAVAKVGGRAAAIARVALSELAVTVAPPALDVAAVEQRAGVLAPAGDRARGAARAEVDGGPRVADRIGIRAVDGDVSRGRAARTRARPST